MTADTHITDPLLLSVLHSAAQARQQSLAILHLIDSLHASATPPTDDTLLHLSKQHKILNTHLAHLRGLNRQAILGVRNTKSETSEARQEIDTLHLQLQNLYYEQRHLRGEIAACEDYAHTYEQISMLPESEFRAAHPEFAQATEHEVTVARIEDEHRQRLALEEARQGLVRRKEALVRETTGKKEELSKLDAEMEKCVLGLEGVRKVFDAREKRLSAEKESG